MFSALLFSVGRSLHFVNKSSLVNSKHKQKYTLSPTFSKYYIRYTIPIYRTRAWCRRGRGRASGRGGGRPAPPTPSTVTGCVSGPAATLTATHSTRSSTISTGATCWTTGARRRPRSRYRLWSSWRPRWPRSRPDCRPWWVTWRQCGPRGSPPPPSWPPRAPPPHTQPRRARRAPCGENYRSGILPLKVREENSLVNWRQIIFFIL